MIVINGLGTGGAERSLAELLPRLPGEGIHPQIVALYRRQDGVENAIQHRYETHFLRSNRLLSRTWELRRLIRHWRPHLVHTTLFESNLVGRLAAWRTPVPVLTSLVNTPYTPARRIDPNLKQWELNVVRAVDRWTMPLTAHFHAITETVKAAAVTELRIPAARISVVPRGRSAERIGVRSRDRRRRVRESLGLKDGDPVLVTVGRQEYQKGHSYLLEAMPAVLSRHPTATLLVIGREGAASLHLRTVLDKARTAQDRIVFLGHREDVTDLMAAADVFVFPSLWEGLGGVLIEAMALGLPIIASNLPAIGEVIEEGRNGSLVPPGNPHALASAIVGLLSDPEQQQEQSENNRRRFVDRFDLDISAGGMIELYRRVASPKNGQFPDSRTCDENSSLTTDSVRSSRAG